MGMIKGREREDVSALHSGPLSAWERSRASRSARRSLRPNMHYCASSLDRFSTSTGVFHAAKCLSVVSEGAIASAIEHTNSACDGRCGGVARHKRSPVGGAFHVRSLRPRLEFPMCKPVAKGTLLRRVRRKRDCRVFSYRAFVRCHGRMSARPTLACSTPPLETWMRSTSNHGLSR